MNSHQILGRIGKDPELRNLESGKSVATFSMATNDSWKDKVTGEKKEITDWHNIVVWGPAADAISKYVKKGDQLFVSGKVRTRKWEKDGVTHYSTETIVDTFEFVGNKGGSRAPAPSEEDRFKPEEASTPETTPTDDRPF